MCSRVALLLPVQLLQSETGYGKESINTAQHSGVVQPQLPLVGPICEWEPHIQTALLRIFFSVRSNFKLHLYEDKGFNYVVVIVAVLKYLKCKWKLFGMSLLWDRRTRVWLHTCCTGVTSAFLDSSFCHYY